MNVWWVNQGQTLEREIAHGCLSTGRFDTSGRTPWHWETVTHMSAGDVTLHVAQRAIRAVGAVQASAQQHERAPHSEPGHAPAGGVWVVPVAYQRLERPILVGALPEVLRPQPPFNRRGNLQQITCCGSAAARARAGVGDQTNDAIFYLMGLFAFDDIDNDG